MDMHNVHTTYHRKYRRCRGGTRKIHSIGTIVSTRPDPTHTRTRPHECTSFRPDNLVHIKCRPIADAPVLNCLLLNARSFCNKAPALAEYVLESSCDLAFITETWLKPGDNAIIKELCPPQYSFKSVPRLEKRGGGIGTLHKDVVDIKQKSTNCCPSSYEIQTLLITTPTVVNCAVIYRPPSSSPSTFLDEFETFLAEFTTRRGKILICGDFNISVNNKDNPFTRKFMELLETFDLSQDVIGSTHNSGNTLDLILTRRGESLVSSVPVPEPDDISDHRPILFTIQGRCNQPTLERNAGRDFRSLDVGTFQSDVADQLGQLDADVLGCTLFQAYCDTVVNCLDQHAPRVSRKRSLKPFHPWDSE